MNKKICNILNEMGIYIDNNEQDINLLDYILDSIQFMDFIIKLEESLNLEIPDEYLDMNLLRSLDNFSEILNNIAK